MKLKQTFFNSPKVSSVDKAKYKKEKDSIIENINEDRLSDIITKYANLIVLKSSIFFPTHINIKLLHRVADA